ncbi:MAG: prepilin-type N-terminal cleavage/methylation protein [Enterobacter kobei]|nr:prepilin-type N-terminal cleavage/methylation protein [Enterobacter kobei]
MSASLKRQAGTSLPEVLLAMLLLVMVITALAGTHRALMTGFMYDSQRNAWQHIQWYPVMPAPGWQVKRMQTSTAGCVSISVTITSPVGRQGQMSRLYCPISQ